MTPVPFLKMHGLGNDFVVLDARGGSVVSPASAAALADRRTGIGCDQVIVIEPPRDGRATAYLRFYNADGSESGACGNGTRCVVSRLMDEAGRDRLAVETAAGLLAAERRGDGRYTVDMGPAHLDWRAVPLAAEADTLAVRPGFDALGAATCCSMGNPHATFFVEDADTVDLDRLGPRLEHDPIFPERANIGVASLVGPDRIRLRVWERGAGATLACGSGACAAGVAAARRGLTGRRVEIAVALGRLEVEWRADGHVLLTGPVATSFEGVVSLS